MSPLDLINELPIPPAVRKWIIYFVIPIAVFVFGVWQASDGDWKVFWTSLVTLGMGAIAHAFTYTGVNTANEVEEYDDYDDGAQYEPDTASASSPPAASQPILVPEVSAPVTPITPEADVAAQNNAVADVSNDGIGG